MSKPQQPELHRSEETPSLNPDAIEGELEARDRPEAEGDAGPVPKANRAGTPSGPVQDKPAPDKFASALGIAEPATPSQPASTADDDATAGNRKADASSGNRQVRTESGNREAYADAAAAWIVPPLRLLARATQRTADRIRDLAVRLENREETS